MVGMTRAVRRRRPPGDAEIPICPTFHIEWGSDVHTKL